LEGHNIHLVSCLDYMAKFKNHIARILKKQNRLQKSRVFSVSALQVWN
jgi:hypothetical protein